MHFYYGTKAGTEVPALFVETVATGALTSLHHNLFLLPDCQPFGNNSSNLWRIRWRIDDNLESWKWHGRIPLNIFSVPYCGITWLQALFGLWGSRGTLAGFPRAPSRRRTWVSALLCPSGSIPSERE